MQPRRKMSRIRTAWMALQGKALGPLSDNTGSVYGFGILGLAGSAYPGDRVNYVRKVGAGLRSSLLMSPIKWMQRNVSNSTLAVEDADGELVPDHQALALLNRPNKFHTLDSLLKSIVYSYILDGNAYLVKQRRSVNGDTAYTNVTGAVEELWWVPHWQIVPKSVQGSGDYISHYEMKLTTGDVKVPVQNVIHFRNGIDPARTKQGLSLVWSEMREIWTDDEAARFTAALLQNNAIPGVIVSPKVLSGGSDDDTVVAIDADAVKKYMDEQFGGRNRGRSMVLSAPTDVTRVSLDPKSMDLHSLRNTCEERICAAIGIPASVVGFGTGLQQTKVGATMRDQIRLAWTGGVIPIQDAIAEQLTLSLVPEFDPRPGNVIVFDRSNVEALQEDADKKSTRLRAEVGGPFRTPNEARIEAGLPPLDGGDELYAPRQGFTLPAVDPGGADKSALLAVKSIADF